MRADQPDPPGADGAQPASEAFRWLPRSRAGRVLLAVAAVAFTGLVFTAYAAPGMVFDLANMVFCG